MYEWKFVLHKAKMIWDKNIFRFFFFRSKNNINVMHKKNQISILQSKIKTTKKRLIFITLFSYYCLLVSFI